MIRTNSSQSSSSTQPPRSNVSSQAKPSQEKYVPPPTLKGMVLQGPPGGSRFDAQMEAAKKGQKIVGDNIASGTNYVPARTWARNSPRTQGWLLNQVPENQVPENRGHKHPFNQMAKGIYGDSKKSDRLQKIFDPNTPNPGIVTSDLKGKIDEALENGTLHPAQQEDGSLLTSINSHRLHSHLTVLDFKNFLMDPNGTGEERPLNIKMRPAAKIWGRADLGPYMRNPNPQSTYLRPYIGDWVESLKAEPFFDEEGKIPPHRLAWQEKGAFADTLRGSTPESSRPHKRQGPQEAGVDTSSDTGSEHTRRTKQPRLGIEIPPQTQESAPASLMFDFHLPYPTEIPGAPKPGIPRLEIEIPPNPGDPHRLDSFPPQTQESAPASPMFDFHLPYPTKIPGAPKPGEHYPVDSPPTSP